MYIMGKIQVCMRDEWRLNQEVAHFSMPTMPYVSHSLKVKERAIAVWDDPQLCEHVIDMLGVSRASIYRWKTNFELYGSVLPPNSGLQGCPSIVTPDMLDDVRDLLHSRPDYYINEIQQWFLIACGIGVSATTVYWSIIDAGYTYKVLRLWAHLQNETDVVFWVYLQG